MSVFQYLFKLSGSSDKSDVNVSWAKLFMHVTDVIFSISFEVNIMICQPESWQI